MEKIKVLLADDHEVVRAGLRRLLGQMPEIEIVAETENGEQAYRVLSSQDTDVALLDLSMPGMGGLETIRRIATRFPSVRVLVFSIHESVGLATRALQAGAEGYVTKGSTASELVEAIQTVASGKRYLSRVIAEKIALWKLDDRHEGSASLSSRELAILRLFGKGKTLDEIAGNLALSRKTVANQLSLVKQKLGVRSSAELMRLVIERSLIEEAEPLADEEAAD